MMRLLAGLASASLLACESYLPPPKNPVGAAPSDFAAGMPAELVVPEGHSGPVANLAGSSSGALIATAGFDRTIRLFETSTFRELRVVRGDRLPKIDEPLGSSVAAARALAFSPDDRLLAASGDDLVVLKVSNGELVHRIRTASPPNAIAFGPAQLAAAVGTTLEVYDAATGSLLSTLELKRNITAVAFAPDRSLLAVGDEDGDVRLVHLGTGEVIRTLGSWFSRIFGRTHASSVVDLEFSSDGSFVASLGSDGELLRYDVASADLLGEAKATDGKSVSVAPDGHAVLVTSDGAIEAFDVPSDRRAFRELVAGAHAAAFGPSSIVVAGDELTSHDLGSGAVSAHFRGHLMHVSSLTVTPNLWMLAGPVGGGILSLDPKSAATSVLEIPGASVADKASRQLKFVLSNGSVIAAEAGALGSSATRFDAGTPKTLLPDAKDIELVDIATSPNGKLLAALTSKGMSLFDTASGREVIDFVIDRSATREGTIRYSPDGRRIAAIVDLRARVFDSVDGHLVWRSAATARDFAYTSDGEFLVTAGPEGVRLFGAAEGTERGTLDHPNATCVAAFSADPRRVASGGEDGQIRFFDVKEGIERGRISAHAAAIRTLALDEARGLVLASAVDGTLAVFRIDGAKELFRARRIGQKEWLVMAPDGRFDVSSGSEGRAYVVRGAKSFGLEESSGRTPNLLEKLLAELAPAPGG